MGRLHRDHATAFIALAHKELNALGRAVAKRDKRRASQLAERKRLGCGATHRDEFEAKTEAAGIVSTHQAVLLKRHG